MTATLDRWWAPEAQVPLASLLTPGGDGKKDLAQGLFALHRAGAEACELVAKTAVADEAVLIAALAENRLHVVPQALDVVSKGVSTPQYAGLLVRDLLDDAESAALALYRTCLAKSVSPPVAAQRVGLVYGVPGRELGRYATLAADPGAKEVAVRDAADRALFTFVSKVVEAEYDEAKVEFSKGPGERERVRERVSDYLDEHNVQNGPDGRFVAEGTSPLARVARGVQRGVARGVQRAADTGRVDRSRAERVERSSAAPQRSEARIGRAEAKVGAKVSRKSKAARQLSPARQEKARVMLSAEAQRMQAMAVRPQEEPPAPKIRPMGQGVDALDMVGERKDPNAAEHGYLDQSLGFVLPTAQWSKMAQQMGQGADVGKPVLVAGALEEYIGQPERFHEDIDDNGNVVISKEHEYQVKQAMHLAKDAPEMYGRPEAWVRRLDAGITRGMSPEAVRGLLQEEAQDLLAEYRAETGQTAAYATERGYVSFVPAYDDPEAMVVVYNPPDEGGAVFGKREAAAITEVVIREDAARGVDLGNGRHTDFVLDKNQALQIEERSHFYDTDLGVFRSRITLAAADQSLIEKERERRGEFGKAMSAERFRELERSGVFQRDEDGEFTAAPTREQTAPVTTRSRGVVRGVTRGRQGRAERPGRVERASRVERAAAPVARAEVTRSSEVTRGGEVNRASSVVRVSVARLQAQATARQILAAPLPTTPRDEAPPLLQLDEKSRYSVVDEETMSLMAADDGFGNPQLATTPWALGYRSLSQLPSPVDHTDAGEELLTAGLPEDLLGARGREQSDKVRPIGQFVVRGRSDLWKLEDAVLKEMVSSGGQRVMTAHMFEAGGDMVVELLVHDRQKPPSFLVRWDTVGDGDVQLVPEGEYHLVDQPQVRAWLAATYASAKISGSSTQFLHDPKVIVYRAETIDDQP